MHTRRSRTLLATAAAALMVGVLPVAALAQDTTNDPDNLDGTFVPSAPGGGSDGGDTGAPDATSQDAAESATDDLPNTGGGLALAGGLAVAGAAVLRRRS